MTSNENAGQKSEDKLANFRPLDFAQNKPTKQVLVVHGNNTPMKKEVVSALTQLGIKPVLRQAKGDAFMPFTQESKKYTNICFVVVILYPDNLAYPHDGNPGNALLRADHKVVFEFGFWTGKLGKAHIFALYREKKRFRQPAEVFDANYTKFDDKNLWKKELANRLSQSGFEIDR